MKHVLLKKQCTYLVYMKALAAGSLGLGGGARANGSASQLYLALDAARLWVGYGPCAMWALSMVFPFGLSASIILVQCNHRWVGDATILSCLCFLGPTLGLLLPGLVLESRFWRGGPCCRSSL